MQLHQCCYKERETFHMCITVTGLVFLKSRPSYVLKSIDLMLIGHHTRCHRINFTLLKLAYDGTKSRHLILAKQSQSQSHKRLRFNKIEPTHNIYGSKPNILIALIIQGICQGFF